MQQGMPAWLSLALLVAVGGLGLGAWLFLRPGAPRAQPPVGVPLPEAAAAWHATGPPASYDRQTIYGYIDGHAEVYLAYGLRGCQAQRYLGPTGEPALTLDLFEMASPADAFGVFTHDRDGEPAGIGRDSLFRYGWLSFWKGRYFASIVAERETEAARQATLALGRALADLLPGEGERPGILSALPSPGLVPRSVRYLHDPQILNTHRYLDSENLLGLGQETPAALAQYDRKEGRADLLVVEYPTAEAAVAARASFERRFPSTGASTPAGQEGLNAARVVGQRLAVVLSASSQPVAFALLDEALGRAKGAVREGGRP